MKVIEIPFGCHNKVQADQQSTTSEIQTNQQNINSECETNQQRTDSECDYVNRLLKLVMLHY